MAEDFQETRLKNNLITIFFFNNFYENMKRTEMIFNLFVTILLFFKFNLVVSFSEQEVYRWYIRRI